MDNYCSKPTEKELYCYDTYFALKIHFNQPAYDFFKFRGRLKNKPEDDHQKVLSSAYKVAKNKSKLEIIEFLFANLLYDKRFWLGDYNSDHEEIYQIWKKRQDSLTYNFTSDLKKIFIGNLPFNAYFKTSADSYPIVMKMLMQNDISIETVIILNKFLKFTNKWSAAYKSDFIMPEMIMKIEKATEFIIRYNDIKDDKLMRFKKMIKNRAEECVNVLPF